MNKPPSTNSSRKNGYMKKSVIKGRMLKSFSDCGCGGEKKNESTKGDNETTTFSSSELPLSKDFHSSSNAMEDVNKKLPYQMMNKEQSEISQEVAIKDKTLNKYDSNIKLFLYSIGKKLLQKFPFKNSHSR